MTTEEWRPIPGYEGRFEASNLGRIRSLCGRGGPRIRSVSVDKYHGYPRITLQDARGNTKSSWLHSWIALAFLGPRPDGHHVRHLDGDKLNNALSNLAYGTPSENSQDTVRHGTHFNGTKTHCKRGHALTPDNVRIEISGGRRCLTCASRKEPCPLCGSVLLVAGRARHFRQMHPELVTASERLAA